MSENFRRKRDSLGGPSTLQINPMTKDFKQPESVLKKTVQSGPRMAELGTVLGLGAAAGYTAAKDKKESVKTESKKTTRKGSPMKANPAGGKKKGMGQEERRRYFGVEKKSIGGEMKRGYGAARQKGMGLEDEGLGLEMSKGSDYIKDLL